MLTTASWATTPSSTVTTLQYKTKWVPADELFLLSTVSPVKHTTFTSRRWLYRKRKDKASSEYNDVQQVQGMTWHVTRIWQSHGSPRFLGWSASVTIMSPPPSRTLVYIRGRSTQNFTIRENLGIKLEKKDREKKGGLIQILFQY